MDSSCRKRKRDGDERTSNESEKKIICRRDINKLPRANRVVNNLPRYICLPGKTSCIKYLFEEALFKDQKQIDLLLAKYGKEDVVNMSCLFVVTAEHDEDTQSSWEDIYLSLMLNGVAYLKINIKSKDEGEQSCKKIMEWMNDCWKRKELPVPELEMNGMVHIDEFLSFRFLALPQQDGFDIKYNTTCSPVINNPWIKVSGDKEDFMDPIDDSKVRTPYILYCKKPAFSV